MKYGSIDCTALVCGGACWLLFVCLFGGCNQKSNEKNSQKPLTSASANTLPSVHNRFDLPIHSRPAPPNNLVPDMEVWALLPYPSSPQRYRLALGHIIHMNPHDAVVSNQNMYTGSIPYSLIFVPQDAGAKPGDFVVAAGPTGAYGGKVHSRQGRHLKVSRIWRGATRVETLLAQHVIVQKGTREPGQIIFYQDKGHWNQGLLLLIEERHAWVVESFGGNITRVGEVEIEPWRPTFLPQIGQEIEVCRGSASNLVAAVVLSSFAEGLLYDVRFSNGSSRKNVPIWEILPSGTILQ